MRLVTLTVRDSGDARADREAIVRAWVRMRAWLQRRVGARPYILAWEVTTGTTGLPHVHAHVVTVWPRIPVRELAAEWVRATGGRAEEQGFDLRTRTVERASRYAAKYATKGVNAQDVSRETFCAWVRATHAKRAFTTSRHLLTRVDPAGPPCCASDGAVWGGSQVRKGPPERESLPTGHVSRETRPPP